MGLQSRAARVMFITCTGPIRVKSEELNQMGKGDKRTRRGKIFKGSHGKTRPGRLTKKPAPAAAPKR